MTQLQRVLTSTPVQNQDPLVRELQCFKSVHRHETIRSIRSCSVDVSQNVVPVRTTHRQRPRRHVVQNGLQIRKLQAHQPAVIGGFIRQPSTGHARTNLVDHFVHRHRRGSRNHQRVRAAAAVVFQRRTNQGGPIHVHRQHVITRQPENMDLSQSQAGVCDGHARQRILDRHMARSRVGQLEAVGTVLTFDDERIGNITGEFIGHVRIQPGGDEGRFYGGSDVRAVQDESR